MIADKEKILQEFPDMVVKESVKKRLNINSKKTVCIVSIKMENPACKLHIGDKKIKQILQTKYMENVLTEDGKKCDT